MDVTITFALPDEEVELQCALDGARWKVVVENVASYVRSRLKYQEEFLSGAEELEAVAVFLAEETAAVER